MAARATSVVKTILANIIVKKQRSIMHTCSVSTKQSSKPQAKLACIGQLNAVGTKVF